MSSQFLFSEQSKRLFDRQILSILESVPDGIILLDCDWRYIYINHAAEIIVKRQREDLLEKNVWEMHPDAMKTIFWTKYHEAVATQTVVPFEYFSPSHQKWFYIRANPSEAGLAISLRDITQFKYNEQQLKMQVQNAQIQSKLVELAGDAILVRDPSSTIVSWNKGAEELYGWTAQEAIGKITHDLLQTRFPESREALDALLLSGEQWEGELMHIRRDGTPIIVESRQVLLRDEQDQPIAVLEINRDITDRKEHERENQEQYRIIVQTANEGIWLIDKDARTLYVNERMAEMLGYSVEEIEERTALDFYFEEDQSNVDKLVENSLQGHTDQFDFRFRRKDGSPLPVLACTSPVHDGRGEIVGALGMFTDLSKRQRAEDQLRFLAEVSRVLASSLDYQETLANIAQLVVPQLADWFVVDLVDDDGQFELLEVEHKDPQLVQWGRSLRELYPIDPHAPAGIPNVVRTGKSELYPDIPDEMLVASARSEEELAIARRVGYTSVMIVPLVARGKNLGAVTFVAAESGRRYDELDLVLAEKLGRQAGLALDNARLYREVAQSRDQLDIILQGVADGIIVYGKNNRIIYANEAAASMTGVDSVQDVLKAPALSLATNYHITDERKQPIPADQLTHMRVFAGEQEAQAIMGYTPTGTEQPERWSLVKSRPVFDEHGEVTMVITIFHDITEQIALEHRKDEFISMTSHELKTPVTSLKGFTNVLQRRLTKQGDEQGLHYLARMDVQLNRLTKLISDLLDISKMQTGQLSFHYEALDLDALLRETVDNVQAATTTHQFQIEGAIDAHVLGDKDRLEQVFINLLTNAAKYSPQANKVIVCLSQDQHEVRVRIQDFGIGIDQAYQNKIFERFYQVTDPEERTYPGLGIGLYISKEIVERHHGRLEVESSKGAGSTFSVILPLMQA